MNICNMLNECLYSLCYERDWVVNGYFVNSGVVLGQIVGLDAPEWALPAPVRSLASVSHLMSLASLRLSEHFATVTTLVAGWLVNIFVGVSGLACLASVIASWFWAGKASCVSVFHCVFLLLPIIGHRVQFPFVKLGALGRSGSPRPGWVTTGLLWNMEI